MPQGFGDRRQALDAYHADRPAPVLAKAELFTGVELKAGPVGKSGDGVPHGLIHHPLLRPTLGRQGSQFGFPGTHPGFPFLIDATGQCDGQHHRLQGGAQLHAIGGDKTVRQQPVHVGSGNQAA